MDSNITNIIKQAKLIPSAAVAQQQQLVSHWQTQQQNMTNSKKRRRVSDNERSLKTKYESPLQSNTIESCEHETR